MISGYLLFPVVYTDMSALPQWSGNIPIPSYSYFGTHTATFEDTFGIMYKESAGH